MYIAGVLLVALIGIIGITIRYLEKDGNTDLGDDIVCPTFGVFIASLTSWGAVIIGIVIGITTYIYKKRNNKKESNV